MVEIDIWYLVAGDSEIVSNKVGATMGLGHSAISVDLNDEARIIRLVKASDFADPLRDKNIYKVVTAA